MHLERLTMADFEKAATHMHVALLPFGGVAAHGRHAPLGTDAWLCRTLADRVEARFPDELLVAPALPLGHAWDLASFPGTISLPGDLLAAIATAAGSSLFTWGLKDQVWLNTHQGNAGPLALAAEQVAERGGRVIVASWWDLVPQRARKEALQHAGAAETSLQLALDPACVDLSEAPERPAPPPAHAVKDIFARSRQLPGALGGDPSGADPKRGRALLRQIDEALGRMVQSLIDGTFS